MIGTRFRRIWLYTLLAIFLLGGVFSITAQSLPRVGIAPLRNEAGDADSETLAGEISQTIRVNLTILGGYEVVQIGQPVRDTSLADLDSFAAANRYDDLIFGSISKPDNRTTAFRVAMYDRAQGSIVYDNSWQITSVFEIFDTADLIVEAMLDQFSEERLAFGRLAIRNTGTRGGYQVFVNNAFLGDDLTQTRLLAGTHNVRIEQNRMYGRFVVADEQVVIPEDGRGQLEIAIPPFTDEEADRIDSFAERIVVGRRSEKADFHFQEIITDYIGLSQDLENAEYSQAVSQRRGEVEQRFNEFVTWYSEPTVIEREVEVQRNADGQVERVGPGRPVAEPGSGGILFRFSQPISDNS